LVWPTTWCLCRSAPTTWPFRGLNLFSYWLFLGGGLTMMSGFLTAGGAAAFGWFGYTPLSSGIYSPGLGGDVWLAGVALVGFSGILTAVNVLATVIAMRHPDMGMFQMPIFTWNMVVTSVAVLLAFPVLTAAVVMLFAERHFGAHVFDPTAGGVPLLWQHLFWFFGHPEVYIVVLPYFGVITETIPVFSRRPCSATSGWCSPRWRSPRCRSAVWAHHMFATGAVLLPFFSAVSLLIAVPTGVKMFNWIGTMWGGQISFKTPMLFSVGFLVSFLMGGVTGVMLASPAIDFHVTDSYFVVAHFHYVLIGGSVFGVFAAIYYWFPKWTGRMLSETLGKWHFWLFFIGFHMTFLVQHMLGLAGMPRRVASYEATDGFTTLNVISSVGYLFQFASISFLLWNVWRSWRHGDVAGDDPWEGYTLEWATTSPPPPHNFDGPLPPITSERPVFDQRHRELAKAAEHRSVIPGALGAVGLVDDVEAPGDATSGDGT
jgi:cytochrome c oxidase subunit 1